MRAGIRTLDLRVSPTVSATTETRYTRGNQARVFCFTVCLGWGFVWIFCLLGFGVFFVVFLGGQERQLAFFPHIFFVATILEETAFGSGFG